MTGAIEVPLPRGWGGATIEPMGSTVDWRETSRSRDAEGWTLRWCYESEGVARRHACDMEGPRRPGDLLLARHNDTRMPFQEYWVLAEVAAKLLDMPILEWWSRARAGRVAALPESAHALVVRGAPGARTLAFGWMQDPSHGRQGEAQPRLDVQLGFAPQHVRHIQHFNRATLSPVHTPLRDS